MKSIITMQIKTWFIAIASTMISNVQSLVAFTTQDTFAKNPNTYFVESGSLFGDGIQKALDAGFQKIYSIELKESFYEKCILRFMFLPSVNLYLGDSEDILPIILKEIDAPATFWLDGHYSGADTAKGRSNTPLLAELEHIAQHPIKTHTILIDDIRQFGTIGMDYITLEQVIEKIRSINPNYEFLFEDGVIPNDILVARVRSKTKYATCEIQGQLGNQLFQIAAVYAYCLDYGYEARFPSLKNAINAVENMHYVFPNVNVSDFPSQIDWQHAYEPANNIFLDLPTTDSNLCLHGYFPSIKYFAHQADAIRKLFEPRPEIIEQITQKYGALLQGPSVAVHVRTYFPDDFDPNNGIGRNNWNYFLRAMDHFPSYYKFLVFSDCPSWIKEYFPKRENVHFIEGNPHWFDFYFMSLCDHQVVSPQSTFSWWAAWLNTNPHKVVIRGDLPWYPDDAFPKEWIKLPCD